MLCVMPSPAVEVTQGWDPAPLQTARLCKPAKSAKVTTSPNGDIASHKKSSLTRPCAKTVLALVGTRSRTSPGARNTLGHPKAANFLDIKPMLDLTCKTVAKMITQKTPEEIRATFNIKNDFTPEEEEQVRKENQWAEDH